jgi:serine/threonine protein kinase
MKYCPQCQRSYPEAQRFCLHDGVLLSLPDPYHLVGRVLLDKYRIEALIGIGGMGAVYSAHHLTINRRIAFKVLLPHLTLGNEQVLKLFQREAETAGRLRHENIVDINDAGRTQDGLAYIAMEWLNGHTLDEEIKAQGLLSLKRTAEILRQIAAALQLAHAQGIVHRDLKPSNVMLTQRTDGREQVKVLDFGIAKVMSEASVSPVSSALGTPHYASPEQLQVGGHLDGRSDIYSLGIMLFQMLTGTIPFNASSVPELIRLHLTAAPPSIRQYLPAAPPEIEQLINRMLAKAPGERPQSALEVVQSFEHAIGEWPQAQTLPQLPPRPTAGSKTVPETDGSTVEPTAAEAGADELAHLSADGKGKPARPPAPAELAPAGGSKASLRRLQRSRVLMIGLLVLVLGAVAYLLAPPPPGPPSPPGPTVTPTSPPAARPRVEVMRYYLEINPETDRASSGKRDGTLLSKRDGTLLSASLGPLEPGQQFKFHFTPRESGYLYLIAPNKQNIPMTFLTAQPDAETGVKTNLIEAGADYSFPARRDQWIGITRGEEQMAFTLIFSPTPLTTPGFLAARAGRDLTATEQHELTLLRQQFGARAPETAPATVKVPAHSASGKQAVITVERPETAGEPVVVEIPIRIERK